ncbi:CO dehydrogenase/acetyl-CoA synthase subunit delta [Candidatus Bathyarchaeota archaeon]|nr:MAG: CO dehydrogenase/acetyl-CoA synthase subunit delta [Candidatus Bathyarchaeota archaeon]
MNEFDPKLLKLLSKFWKTQINITDKVGDLNTASQLTSKPKFISSLKLEAPQPEPMEIIKTTFTPPIIEYPGNIVAVKLGATKGEGGTRGKSIIIGGEKTPTFYAYGKTSSHPPVVAFDIFDTKIPLPKVIKMHVKDVMGDPGAWAKRCVDKFGAEMITLQLISTDPKIKDTSPNEAAKTVEDVLQAVDVPLAVGGCGDPVKDLSVFEKVAEVAEGERLLISSVSPWMDTKKAAETIKKHGHVALALSGMDMNEARELNHTLYGILPREQIVMDTSTAALGSGLEFTYTLMARIRLAALMGDYELQHPMASGVTNAWFARESWMKMSPQWEPRELRGPLWETVTALTSLLAGVDYFMMMHPTAAKTVMDVIQWLRGKGVKKSEKVDDWISIRI